MSKNYYSDALWAKDSASLRHCAAHLFLKPCAIFFAVPLLAIPCFFALFAIAPGDIDYARARGAKTAGVTCPIPTTLCKG